MKTKTINKVLTKVHKDLCESIKDPIVKDLVDRHTIITGGAIASMLLREKVNDYDLYFRNHLTTLAVAEYYLNEFKKTPNRSADALEIEDLDGRIRIVVPSRGTTRGETIDIRHNPISDEIDDLHEELEDKAMNQEGERFKPVFLSTNAITLTGKVQLILRFYGMVEDIHTNYDFTHCTNYWTSWDEQVHLKPEAMEALLTKELKYVGSKYPVCSLIRLRKFIKRGFTINAGQILKMVLQCNELDLTDPVVLEDQLTGVDMAYFEDILCQAKMKDPDKINTAYLVEIIDRMF